MGYELDDARTSYLQFGERMLSLDRNSSENQWILCLLIQNLHLPKVPPTGWNLKGVKMFRFLRFFKFPFSEPVKVTVFLSMGSMGRLLHLPTSTFKKVPNFSP